MIDHHVIISEAVVWEGTLYLHVGASCRLTLIRGEIFYCDSALRITESLLLCLGVNSKYYSTRRDEVFTTETARANMADPD